MKIKNLKEKLFGGLTLSALAAAVFFASCSASPPDESSRKAQESDGYHLIGIEDVRENSSKHVNFDNNKIRLLLTYNEKALDEAGSILKAADFWSFDEEKSISANSSIASTLLDIDAENFTPLDGLPLATVEIEVDKLDALEDTRLFSYVMIDMQVPPALESSGLRLGSGIVNARGGTGQGTTVVVIDSGVQSTHPFFDGRVVEGACYSSTFGTSVSLCPPKTPGGAPASSGDTVLSGNNCTGAGLCYHGTHVAGIVAGEANGQITYSGVAPEADIMAIQIFHKETKQTTCAAYKFSTPCILSLPSDNIRALKRVLDRADALNIVAINMSTAAGEHKGNCDKTKNGAVEPQKVIIDRLLSVHGIVSIASTGNYGYKDAIGSPSCISSVVAVGSVIDNAGRPDDNTVSNFSNMSDEVDLLAPGTFIDSSTIGSAYRSDSGTSMASPQVAGAIAALVSLDVDNITPSEALQALKDTATRVDDQRPNGTVSTTQIDITAAAQQLRPIPPQP